MEKMYPPVVNSPKTELTELITDKQTEITVANASVLLQGEGIAVLGNGDAAETITYTSVEDNVLKGCVRGFEGVARAWPVGTRIARNFTAADWRAAINNIQALHEEASSESRKPITLQPGVQIVKTDKQALFNLAGLTGKTVIDYDGQKGLFGVRNPYVIRYGENLLPSFYEWTVTTSGIVTVQGPNKATAVRTTADIIAPLKVVVPVLPNTTYTMSSVGDGLQYIERRDSNDSDPSGEVATGVVVVGAKTFTTSAQTSFLSVRLRYASVGTFNHENPMLNIGSTAKPFKPREDSMLALQTDLYADPVTGANADTVFERDGQYFKSKKWQGLTLDGNRAWVLGEGGATAGVRQVRLVGVATGAVAGSGIGVKFDGKILPQGSTGNTADTNAVTAAGDIYFGIPVADSGWADSYGPTQDDIKAYFFGYKAYDANTITPATAQAATTATWNGTGTKYWVQRVGAANFTQSVPQASYAGYTPYKLVYQLATPTVEPIVSEGQLSFIEGDNQVEVGTGIVLREAAKPSYESTSGNYQVNNSTLTGSALRNKAERILNVFRNNVPDKAFEIFGNTAAYGVQLAVIKASNYDPVASYSTTYLMLDKSPVVPLTGSYAANEKTLMADLVDSVQQNTARVSVLENKKADKDNPAWLSPTLLNGAMNTSANEQAVQYLKTSDGYVMLRGVLNVAALNTMAFRLPAGYRPLKSMRFVVSANQAFGQFLVGASGDCFLSSGSLTVIDLSGIVFLAGQ